MMTLAKRILAQNDIQAHLSPQVMKAYLAKSLSSKEQQIVEAHLLECPFCNEAMEGIEAHFQPHESTQLEKNISEIQNKIRAKVSKNQQDKFIKRYPFQNQYAVAAAVALTLTLGFAAIYLWNGFAKQDSTTSAMMEEMPTSETSPNAPTQIIKKENTLQKDNKGNVPKTNDIIQNSTAETAGENLISDDLNKENLALTIDSATVAMNESAKTEEAKQADMEYFSEDAQENRTIDREKKLTRKELSADIAKNSASIVIANIPPMPSISQEEYQKYLKESVLKIKDITAKGSVIVSFIVNKNGKLSDFSIIKSLCKECDQKAISIIKRGANWKPALQNQKVIEQKTTVEIIFP
jgi:TonB family protein